MAGKASEMLSFLRYYLRYFRLRLIAAFMRFVQGFKADGRIKSFPDRVLRIESRDTGRTIKLHIYDPQGTKLQGPQPVLINMHGSGFVLALHGQDQVYCRAVADRAGVTVLDAQYRLAPEYPFPAAFDDVVDVVRFVLSRPAEFDAARVHIGGFSAGGNLALAVSSSGVFAHGTFSSLITFYPPTNVFIDPSEKKAPDPTGEPLPDWACRFFNTAYVFPDWDVRNPRICPTFSTTLERFPDRWLLVTCAQDNLAPESEELASRVAKLPGKEVRITQAVKVGHAWDKVVTPGSHEEKERDRMYGLAIEMLQTPWPTKRTVRL